MREDLGWSYTQAGLLDAANAVGYVVGALFCPALLDRMGHARALRSCAALTALSLLGCSVAPNLGLLLVLRGARGCRVGPLFVVGALLAGRFGRTVGRPGAGLSSYYAGVGPGSCLPRPWRPVC